MSDRSAIDWLRGEDGKAGASINPWGHGCYGPGGTAEQPRLCSYCFAKRQSLRKMNKCPQCQAFIPHWHPAELEKPLHWKRPRRIFVESMGDPFGDWVTREQMGEVLAHMVYAPQHTYYLLTKQPQNILRLLGNVPPSFLPNLWLGASVDTQARADASQDAMWRVREAGWHTFVSVEPMLSRVVTLSVAWAEWIIVGAQSGRDAAKHQPEREWVQLMIEYADLYGIPVFLKRSITALFPDLTRQEWPEGETHA